MDSCAPPCVHDHDVLGYDVDWSKRTLTLRTRNPVGERGDVRFDGLIAHHLAYGSRRQNILFGIEETELADLVGGISVAHEGLGDSADAALVALRAEGVRAWRIEASVGPEGWVLATSYGSAAT